MLRNPMKLFCILIYEEDVYDDTFTILIYLHILLYEEEYVNCTNFLPCCAGTEEYKSWYC